MNDAAVRALFLKCHWGVGEEEPLLSWVGVRLGEGTRENAKHVRYCTLITNVRCSEHELHLLSAFSQGYTGYRGTSSKSAGPNCMCLKL